MFRSKPTLQNNQQRSSRKTREFTDLALELLYGAYHKNGIALTNDIDAIIELRTIALLARRISTTKGPVFKLDHQEDYGLKNAFVIPVSDLLNNLLIILNESNLERIWEHLPSAVPNPWAILMIHCFYYDKDFESNIPFLCEKPLLELAKAEYVCNRLNEACERFRKESKSKSFIGCQKGWRRSINKNKASLKAHFSELLKVHTSLVVSCASLGYGKDANEYPDFQDPTMKETELHWTWFKTLMRRDILLKTHVVGYFAKITYTKRKGCGILLLLYIKNVQQDLITEIRKKIKNLWIATVPDATAKLKITPPDRLPIATLMQNMSSRSLPAIFMPKEMVISSDLNSKDKIIAFIDEVVEWDDIAHINPKFVKRSYRKTEAKPKKKTK